ncbi:MAG: ribonuclease HII [Clostridiales bacterium]|uniref:ribonuclease HII n=1 Tax=Oscillospiraceae TaxID=216572 RepID=UPI0009A8086C|nr:MULTISPECIES: ribonuclease HII [Oscillospiraceae]PWM36436.1 MAG: ribonuclease HII [Clostridiales bacterium]RGB66523.1 ribonuclease HII [Harryflintia acetispora]
MASSTKPEFDLYQYEREAYRTGFLAVCGVDEAGRGPLAGPVYAAAVILPKGLEIEGLNDSKKLSEKKRDELYDIICAQAAAYCVASADEREIDKYNILQATFLAMRRAVEGLGVAPDLVLVDGNQDPQLPCEHTLTIVKGDQRSASIAAASILAKVSRDRYMLRLAQEYPQYELQRHKGYPTKAHYERLRQFGPAPIHRMSFLKKFFEGEKKG